MANRRIQRGRGAGEWCIRVLLAIFFTASCISSASKHSSQESRPSPTTTPVPTVRPEALAGDWLFEMTRGGEPIQYSLHFSVTNGILAGGLTGPDGNSHELTKISLKEDKVAWDIEGDSGTLHYDGKIDGTSMKGTAKRTGSARRGQRDSSGAGGGSPGGYGRSGRSGRFGGRRGGSQEGDRSMTWSAYKSVAPPSETNTPAPTPTALPDISSIPSAL